MKNKILLFGFTASGKTQFNKLVDGHSKISVIERHDKILNPLISIYNDYNNFEKKILKKSYTAEAGLNLDESITKKNKLKYKSKNIEINLNIFLLRFMLEETGYNLTEYWSFLNKAELAAASKNLNDNFDFQFNFDLFENYWKKNLFKNSKTVSPEEFNDIFLEAYIQGKGENLKENLLFQSPNTMSAIDFILKENFNTKVIFLKRSLEGTIKSRALRQMYFANYLKEKTKFDNKIKNNIDYHISAVLNSSYIERLKISHKKIKDLKEKNDKKFLIIKTEDLILSPKKTIKSVFKWLDLEEEDIIFKPTYKGNKTESNDFGRIQDDELELKTSTYNFLKFRADDNNLLILFGCNEKIKTFFKIIKYYFFKYFKF